MPAEPEVFVVDDDEAVRDSLSMLLESAGLSVRTFGSAPEFLDSDAPSRSGCLLIDVRMPGMDGIEVQERLRATGCPLPVIVMTGHADVPLAVRAMKAGAIDFVEKPFDEDALLSTIRTAMSRTEAVKTPAPAAPPAAVAPEVLERLAILTPREREVLEGLVAGHPNKVIAYQLSISPRTVEIHRARVMEKMQADSLPKLVRMAISAGITPAER
ncbi:response regulator FixJ [Arenibaculum pallidiluteum]|uniref:response regulator FixJ n=1 Tax=Arenibaculum pallidiluteum TaxID=2812559 RepID=UPI001A965EF5|nr:response regulator FixJ [Arenibaculum pallidiluteum]